MKGDVLAGLECGAASLLFNHDHRLEVEGSSPWVSSNQSQEKRRALARVGKTAEGVIVMKLRYESVWTIVVLGVLVYGFYAAFTEAWPMGLINLAQQSVFGAYSVKVSLLIFIAGALLLAALVSALLVRITARDGSTGVLGNVARNVPAKQLPMRAQNRSQARLLLQVGAGFVAALWLGGGFGAFFWVDRQQHGDNVAEYRALLLDESADVTVAEGEHLTIRGTLLNDRAVVHRSGLGPSARNSYFLLPIVPSSWKAGQPVRLIIKVDSPAQLAGYDAGMRGAQLQLLVRVAAAVPVTTASQFEKIGVPLAPDHHMVHVIASNEGKPVRQDKDYFQHVLLICGVGTALMILLFASSAWIVHRRERR